MNKLVLPAFMAAAALLPAAAHAGACDDPGALHRSAVVNIGSASTAAIVGAVSGARVHVCGFTVTAAGTAPTVEFESGMQASTACDTGAAALSGAFAPTAGTTLTGGYGDDLMQTPPGSQLCIVAGGTPSIQGVVSFVQK
jgi:hypothetical protein